MKIILLTIIVALVIGFLLGLLLGLFKKIFAVHVDPKVQQIRDVLSGANCGGCGFAGCDAFAEAIVSGDAPVNGCVAGGAATADAIAKVLGVDAGSTTPKVAFLACQGTKECAADRGEYQGVKTCAAAQLTMNGIKKCSFGCIGFGDCEAACSFGGITMGADGLPVIDKAKCFGCGKCVRACPKHLITLIDANTKGAIALCSCKSENKPQIRKDCSAGCFKCGMCARKCPVQAITMENGLPKIDYSKCTSCGECVKACVDKVLVLI